MLLTETSWWKVTGAVLFALDVAVPVWLRRFGRAWRAGGTVAAVPFLAVLVHPVPEQISWEFLGWMLVAAAVAYAWAAAIHVVTAAGRAPTVRTASAPARSRRVAASTRMAIQLAPAVGGAFTFGQWVNPAHLVWPVLTTLIVHSGNRGRGDVLWKGTERTVGTLLATGLAGTIAPANDIAIVAIFVILALAAGLRESSYVYQAACTTAALAFLYGYFGQSGTDLLAHRLLGVLAGGVTGVAAAWFVLPVRTTDITRLRVGAVLAAAAEVAASAAGGTPEQAALDRLAAAEHELAALTYTLRAARRFGLGPARHLDNTATHARTFAHNLAALTTGPENATATRAHLTELTRQIAHARRTLPKPAT